MAHKFIVSDEVYWIQRIGYSIKTMTGIIKEIDGDNVTVAPHKNSHKSWWRTFNTKYSNPLRKRKGKK